jgi:hypothetical protein
MDTFGGGSQFGGGSAPDDYDFFAPTRGGGSGITTNNFGVTPVGPAPTFGSGVGVGGGPYPAASAPPSPRAKVFKGLGVLGLVAVVVVGGWFGWTRYQLSRPLTVPASLSAMSPVGTKQVEDVKASVEEQWRQDYPGQQLAIEVYSGRKAAIVLAMARGTANIEKDFHDAGFSGTLSPVGHAQCAQIQDRLVGCERSSRTLSAMVLYFGGTAQDAAAALDEAWELQ